MAKQTTFKAADAMSAGNISIPFGIVRLVRTQMERLGLYRFFGQFKTRGIEFGYVFETMCVLQLSGNDSFSAMGELISSDTARDLLTHGYKIESWTMNRDIRLLHDYFEETIEFLHHAVEELYPEEGDPTVFVDGSHVERYGSKGGYTKAGEGGGTIQLQDQFMVAQNAVNGLSIMAEVYDGNLNDPPQYKDFLDQLKFYLKKGTMIVMDSGGSSAEILGNLREDKMEYLTRTRMNGSDGRTIQEDIGSMVYVGSRTGCIAHSFESSGKTNYLFFSADLFMLQSLSAERRAKREQEEREFAQSVIRSPKLNKVVKIRKSDYFDVVIDKFSIQTKIDPWSDDTPIIAEGSKDGEFCGWFKLTCSKPLLPHVALTLYRGRVRIEHLISSMKSAVNLKPLRVWNKASVRGALLMAMIAELFVAMLKHDMEPDVEVRMVDGRMRRVESKPSDRSILASLGHLTVTRFYENEWSHRDVYSNQNALNMRCMAVIDGYSEQKMVDFEAVSGRCSMRVDPDKFKKVQLSNDLKN